MIIIYIVNNVLHQKNKQKYQIFPEQNGFLDFNGPGRLVIDKMYGRRSISSQ